MSKYRWLALVPAAALALTGCTIQTGGSEPDARPDQTTEQEQDSGSAAVEGVLRLAWDEMTPKNQAALCVGWASGQQEVLVRAFMRGMDTDVFSPSEIEAGLRQFMDEECG